jgi:hypothetical protein
MTKQSSRYVIPTDPGDPTTALYIDEQHVVCGTLMGRVWLYNRTNDTRTMLAGFSDDAIRGIYVQDVAVYATVGDQCCRVFRIHDPIDQLETKFDRRSGSTGYKYVIQKFNQVTMIYPGMTTFADVVTNDQSMCPFKLQQANILNVIPIDSFQHYLLLTEFPATTDGDDIVRETRHFKIVDVSSGNHSVFILKNPTIAVIKLIDKQHVFYVDKVNRKFVIHNFHDNKTLVRIKNPHKTDIVGVDSIFHLRLTRPEDLEASMSSSGGGSYNSLACKSLITTVSIDGKILAWDYLTGKVYYEGFLRQYSFSLGFPYIVQSWWDETNQTVIVAVSHDHGVSIVDLVSS